MSVIVKFKKYPELGWLKVVSDNGTLDGCRKCVAYKSGVDHHIEGEICRHVQPAFSSCGTKRIHYERIDNVKDRA